MGYFNSFLLIPNHSMAISGGMIIVESAEVDMIKKLGERFSTLGIAAFRTRASNTSLSGELAGSQINVHSLNGVEHGRGAAKILNYLHALLVLPFILRNYDVIYIFCPGYCGLVASLWARLLGKPYGLYVRGTWLNKSGGTSFWWRWVFEDAKFMIVTGESFKRRLLQYCGNVWNEVPLTALKPKQICPSDLIDRSPSKMIFAGRINESKGVRDVVRAVALLKQQGLLIELMIAGGGTPEEMNLLDKLKLDLDVQESVKMLGHIPPAMLAEAYQSCAIFVFPSYYAEGFPRVLYEAMMYGLAIVTCEMPGTEGFLVNGVNCVYTRPNNPEHLANSLRRLLEDKELSSEISAKARKDVECVYDSFVDESHAHQILRLLN